MCCSRYLIILLGIFLGWHKPLSACEPAHVEPQLSIVSEFLPPYQYLDANGDKTGYSVEIIDEILNQAQLQANIEYYPWQRAFRIALKRPNTLIFSILRTPEREAQFHWIGELHREQYFFYRQAGNNELNEVIPDKHTIAVYSGSPHLNYLRKNNYTRLEVTDRVENSIKMLATKRADFLLTNDYALMSLMRNLGIDQTSIEKASVEPEFTSQLYFAVSKNSNTCLVEKLKHAYQTLVENGQLSRLQIALEQKH